MKISKEKRSQIVLTIVIILLVAMGIYSGLIRFQQAKLRNLGLEKLQAERKLKQIQETSENAAKIDAELVEVGKELDAREQEMASGDLYLKTITTIRNFKANYPVEIKQFSPKGETEMNLFPKYPYHQYTVALAGSAYYHDLGKFIADFENHFRSFRIVNLDLVPESSQEREKLMFRMDVVSLVKPAQSVAAAKPATVKKP